MDPRRAADPSAPPAGTTEVALRDGSRIWVRAIQPDDRQRIVEGLNALSDRSRYLRFHTHVDRLTESQLDYLVDVDHHDHDALVALDPDLPDTPGVGVARYIRLHDDPTVAEAAVTVVDDHQGLGIGTTLIRLLERLAFDRGIRTFRNYVLAENTAMLEVFRQLGGEVTRETSGLYRVDLPVPPPDREERDAPRVRWVATVADAEERQRSTWAYPLVWLARRLGADVEPPVREHSLLKGWVDRGDAADPPGPDA